jgi:dihydrofolate reductase
MVSLDGFVETTDKSLDWVTIDDEIHALANEHARAADAFVYGRGMYELMAGYWPTADADPSASAGARSRRWSSRARSRASTGTAAWSAATPSPRSPP